MNIKIGEQTIEVYPEDAPESMTWDAAVKWCESLGDGWRLPTSDELDVLYENRNELVGFASDTYWSSSEDYRNYAWTQCFCGGSKYYYYKKYSARVRAVRNVEQSKRGIMTQKEIAERLRKLPLGFGDLFLTQEIMKLAEEIDPQKPKPGLIRFDNNVLGFVLKGHGSISENYDIVTEFGELLAFKDAMKFDYVNVDK